jgi:hypothetical protein
VEFLQYIYDKLNAQYPNQVTTGMAEGKVDDKILLWQIESINTQVKDNQYVGQSGVVQITKNANSLQTLLSLYEWCIKNIFPDKVNMSSCVVTEHLLTQYKDGNHRIDIRVSLSK